MRTIKFRGKRLDNGAWVEGHYFKTPLTAEFDVAPENGAFFDSMRKTPRYCISDGNGVVFEVDHATIGQYTELKDKNNGICIFEGDILSLSGILIGNKYENEGLLKDGTNLLIDGLCTKEWLSTYQEAIKRGCINAK